MIRFNSQRGLIIVTTRLSGPTGAYNAHLALDTGANATFVRNAILVAIGYNPNAAPQTVRFTTGSGVAGASRVTIDKLEALGQARLNFSIVAHTLPPSASVDGVLGLDFLRSHILTLDFQKGEIILV